MTEGKNLYILYFREYDHSDHYRHHLYYVVNFGDTIMDEFFGTAYDPVKFIIFIFRKTIR